MAWGFTIVVEHLVGSGLLVRQICVGPERWYDLWMCSSDGVYGRGCGRKSKDGGEGCKNGDY